MIEAAYPPSPELNRIQRPALILGILGLVLLVVGAVFSPQQFFRSYLLGYLFWVGIGLGCLGVTMLHNLSGGAWGMVIRGALESGARTLPLMGLLFLPLAFGLPFVYEWARPEVVAEDPLLQHKSPYLNVPFFLLRTLLYFVVWAAIAYLLTKWSMEENRRPDPLPSRRIRVLSAIGLVLLGLTVTFAAIDWVMSLEPHWFSSIFGAVVGMNAAIAGFAFVITIVALLADRKPLAEVMTHSLFNDLGSLLLAFVMIWAYLAFSQFMLIWAANLPEEVTWYIHRLNGGWQWLALSVALFQFAVPFVLLLSRDVRSNRRHLALLAAFLVFMFLVNLFWTVVPSFHEARLYVHWLDFVAPIALGGIWVAVFVWQLRGRPLVPPPVLPALRERAETEHERH